MIKDYFEEAINLKKALLENADFAENLVRSINILRDCLLGGNKVLIAGNGGSAADAQHFAAEIVGKFKKKRRAYPAIALTTNTSVLTAWSNDYDFASLFERQIEALGKPGDIFFGISTSGRSENVVKGVLKAGEMGLETVCLLGNDGGKLCSLCGTSLIVPSSNTPRIQEVHITIIHIICEEIEKSFN